MNWTTTMRWTGNQWMVDLRDDNDLKVSMSLG
jgi:hypothetical protein